MARSPLHATADHVRRLARCSAGERTDKELLEAFTRRQDEGAFAALVSRYSALVMGVCRRALGHHHDAEDAFQATFLVFARKAGSIRRQEALASWLYGVAHRAALDVKRCLLRQRDKEQRGARREATGPPEDLSWREVQGLLDEEVEALPESFRQAFVLCAMHGLSKPEAARQLGLKEGTVASRLARARRRLQQRLADRGVTLSALMGVLELSREGAVAGASVRATAALVVADAAGACSSSTVPARVAALADGVTSAMLLTKTKVATALVLLGALLAAGAGVLFAPLAAQPSTGQEKSTPAAKGKAVGHLQERERLGGVPARVVDPDGRPVKGAKVYLMREARMEERPSELHPAVLAASDSAGRLTLGLPHGERPAGAPSEQWMAVAPGFGPALRDARAPAGGSEVTFRLVKDVPILGRIVNLEGKPIAGVTVRPFQIAVTEKEDLSPWLKAAQTRKLPGSGDFFRHEVGSLGTLPGLAAQVTTDADGRFCLTGVGRERLVGLWLAGPKVECDTIVVMTRPGKALCLQDSLGSDAQYKVYPATFQHVVSPPYPLVGTVRDGRTGKPLAGATIDLGMGHSLLRAKTKEDGSYRLDSLPGLFSRLTRPGSLAVMALPAGDQPYLPIVKWLWPGRRSEPLRVDFSSPHGLWAEGRVIDKRTDEPVRAWLEYLPESANANLKDFPDYAAGRLQGMALVPTGADGSFRIPVLPGPGLLAARATSGAYLRQQSLPDEQARRLFGVLQGAIDRYHALGRIDPKADVASVQCELKVDPGLTLACRLVGPDGNLVTGAHMRGLTPGGYWEQRPLAGAELTVRALRPGTPRWLVVLHAGAHLGASVEVKAGMKEPLTIRLKPTGTITGRLLSADGRPWRKQALRICFDKPGAAVLHNHLPEVVHSDDEGRFRVEGIISGLSYRIDVAGKPPRATAGSVKSGLALEPAEHKDVGDVKASLIPE
jgi:RNA polymerase sigma factor (sigma-70 family)